MLAVIRAGLSASLDARVVDELLTAHTEVKRNYFLGGLRLSAVEGGRFSEAAFRLLQQRTTGTFDALGTPLDTDRLIRYLAQIPAAQQPESVRLHIPRTLRVIYDIRNRRDAAHLADGIDPNLQDATLVTTAVDWVLAEFVRLYHNVSADEAQRIVADLVSRTAPVIEEFGEFLKVLRTDLGARDHCLLLLYQRGQVGATLAQLNEWARPSMRTNLRRTLRYLTDEEAFVHFDGANYFITRSGVQAVEDRRLMC